jgi:hypothetical protein
MARDANIVSRISIRFPFEGLFYSQQLVEVHVPKE